MIDAIVRQTYAIHIGTTGIALLPMEVRMWIFTKDGFFSISVTPFCGPGEVAVRARRREHLENLMARHNVQSEILVFKEADYRFRIQIPREQWGQIMHEEGNGVDYESFKDAMGSTTDDADYTRAMSATRAAIRKIQMNELPQD
jgi:hypothetical protein